LVLIFVIEITLQEVYVNVKQILLTERACVSLRKRKFLHCVYRSVIFIEQHFLFYIYNG